jgi:hypothetical protein
LQDRFSLDKVTLCAFGHIGYSPSGYPDARGPNNPSPM